MNWREQPNASYYSARYAERKRAAERARDALPTRAVKCERRSCYTMITRDVLCSECRAEYERLRSLAHKTGDYSAADAFILDAAGIR